MRWTYVISYSVTITFALLIFLLEEDIIGAAWVQDVYSPQSPYPPGSVEENDWCLRYLIPLLIFIEKLFINI